MKIRIYFIIILFGSLSCLDAFGQRASKKIPYFKNVIYTKNDTIDCYLPAIVHELNLNKYKLAVNDNQELSIHPKTIVRVQHGDHMY